MSDRMKRTLVIETEVDRKTLNSSEQVVKNFFDKYSDKKMRVATPDFQGILQPIRDIEKEVDRVTEKMPHMLGAISNDTRFLTDIREEFEDVTAIFTDGSIAKGFDAIMEKTKTLALRSVDLGDFLSYTQKQAQNTVDALKEIGAVQLSTFNGQNYLSLGDLDTDQLEVAIDLMQTLIEYQSELDAFNEQPLKGKELYSGTQTSDITRRLTQARKDLNELKQLNLSTMTELVKRRDIQSSITNDAIDRYDYWEFKDVKESAQNDKDQYQKALKNLQDYVAERQNILEQLRNSTYLFTGDELIEYTDILESNISNSLSQIEELQQIGGRHKDVPISGDFGRIEEILEEIKKSISIISDVFQSESDAMRSMVDGEVSSFTSWSEAIVSVYNNLSQLGELVDTIANKDFNITNITNPSTESTSTSKRNTVKQLKAEVTEEMKHVKALYDDAYKLVDELKSKGMTANVYRLLGAIGSVDEATGLPNLSSYSDFEQEIISGMADAKTKAKIENILVLVDGYITKLQAANKLRAEFGLGEWQDPFSSDQQAEAHVANANAIQQEADATKKLNDAQKEVESLHSNADSQNVSNLAGAVDEVSKAVDRKNAGFVKEKEIVDASVGAEVQQLALLKNSIAEVSKAIGRKNAGFIQEQEIVNTSVEAEKAKLRELVDVITADVGNTLDNIKVKFAQSFVVPELDQNKLQASFDEIFNKFMELKDKIQTMKIDIDINGANITTAVQQALYAKEIAQKYRLAKFDDLYVPDLFDLTGGTVMSQLTGETLDKSEARRIYAEDKTEYFVDELGIVIGTMQEVIQDIARTPDVTDNVAQENLVQVIVEAINTNGNNIVESIKLLLPKSVTDHTDDEKLINAFNSLTETIQEYRKIWGGSVEGLFNAIKKGAQLGLKNDPTDALNTLGLISNGKPNFAIADVGGINEGTIIGEKFVLSTQPNASYGVPDIATLMEKQNKAYELGAAVPRIISGIEDKNGNVFQLQTKAPGVNHRKEESEMFGASPEQIDRLLYTFEKLIEVGLYPEFGGDNVMYDPSKGFTVIDLDLTDRHGDGLDSPDNMVEEFLRSAKRKRGGSYDEMQKFRDLVRQRYALSPEQRLVNANTIATERAAQQAQQASEVRAKITPIMDDGAVAKVVADNVAKTPATVKVTPVIDDGKIVNETKDEISDLTSNLIHKLIDYDNQPMANRADNKQKLYDENPLLKAFNDETFLVDTGHGMFDSDFMASQLEKFIKQNLSSNLVQAALKSQQAVDAESQSATDAARQFIEAANAKKEFVDANKLVAQSADESVESIKKEAEAIDSIDVEVSRDTSIDQEVESRKKNIEAIREEIEAEKEKAKEKDIYDGDGNPIKHEDVYKYEEDKAIVTERIVADADGNEVLRAIVRDFEKFNKEEKKTEDAIARAQSKLDEFVKKFRSKTGGNAQFIDGFNALSDFKVDKDNVEDAFNLMTQLQARYNELEENFRKGQSSLNPFTNAITKASNIDNIFGEVEYKFNALIDKSGELGDKFARLNELKDDIKAFVDLINTNPSAISPDKFMEFSKQVGEFNLLKTQVEGAIKAQGRVEKENEEKRIKSVREYIDLIKKKNEYELKATKGGTMQAFYGQKAKQLQDEIAKNDKSSIMNQEEKNRLLQIEEEHYAKIAELLAKQSAKQDEINGLKKQDDSLRSKHDAGYVSDALFSQWENEFAEYQKYLDGTVAADETTIQKKKASLTRLYDQLNKMSNSAKTFFASGGEILSTWFDTDQIKNAEQSLRGLYEQVVADRFAGMETSIKGVNGEIGKLTFTVNDGEGHLSAYTIALNKSTGATKLLGGQSKETLTTIQQFSSALKGDIRGIFTAFVGGMSILHTVGRYIKEGIQAVRELDAALTELKKVTDETEETYDKFLQTAAKTGERIGSTLSNVTSATAEFAKLGYDINQAASMAEAALVYTNVGDNMDVDTASQSIISTLKAFGIEADNTMSIVDKFNEVGEFIAHR